MKILIISSTLPASDTDPVPAFVRDQAIWFHKLYPELDISILAPHDARSKTSSFTKHKAYNEYRFHYFWPRRLEKLTGRGIMPQLKKNPFYYFVIPFLFWSEKRALKKMLQSKRPDVLYAHWFTPQGIVAGNVTRKTGLQVVLTTHSSDVLVWKKIPFVGPFVVRRHIGRIDRLTAVSKRTLEKLKQFYSNEQWQMVKNKTRIIPMGVDLPKNSLSKAGYGKNILFIGRLAEKKGVQYLLPAFKKVISRHPDAKLTIAGDGPMLDKLRSQAGSLGVDVNFPGYVSGQTKLKLIKNTDIYVVPSIITESGDSEGMPVSLMEGLAAGKICVATNESGADDIITNGKDGFLVPQKDEAALHRTLAKTLGMNKYQRQRIQRAAAVTAKQFDWAHVAKEHFHFLFK